MVDGNQFAKPLKQQSEAILAQIDEPPISSSTPTSELLPMLIKMSAQKRNEATEIAAE